MSDELARGSRRLRLSPGGPSPGRGCGCRIDPASFGILFAGIGAPRRACASGLSRMSDVEISARIIEQSPTSFLVMVTSAAAAEGDEDSATDLRTAEARTRREAERMRDALIGQTVEAIE